MQRTAQVGKDGNRGLITLGLLVPRGCHLALHSSGCALCSSLPTLLYNETFMDPDTPTLAQEQQTTVAQKGQATK